MMQVTVDAREGISTGISAEDRSRTLRLLADPAAAAADFRRPGHINPLRCGPGRDGFILECGKTRGGALQGACFIDKVHEEVRGSAHKSGR